MFSKCLLISVAYLCFPHPEKMKIHGRKQASTRPMSPLLRACDISSYNRKYSSRRMVFSSCLSRFASGRSLLLPNCLRFPFWVIISFAIASNCSHVGSDLAKSSRDTCALFTFVAASLQTSRRETVPTCWMTSCMRRKPGFELIFPVSLGRIWLTCSIRVLVSEVEEFGRMKTLHIADAPSMLQVLRGEKQHL